MTPLEMKGASASAVTQGAQEEVLSRTHLLTQGQWLFPQPGKNSSAVLVPGNLSAWDECPLIPSSPTIDILLSCHSQDIRN